MSFVRTVLGDVDASTIGVCYAHEHLIIDGSIAKIINPDISLQDVDAAVEEVRSCAAAGVSLMVDAMPCDASHNVVKLAEISRRTNVHVVVATGLHHGRYYGERHWSEILDPDELADLFVADIDLGVDALDYCGPIVQRTPHRAGLIKVAGSEGGLTDRDRRTFEAAAGAASRTGAAILTHCENGRGGTERVERLAAHGVAPNRVLLSHTDKVADRGYHRDLAATGAYLEYDQGIRTPDQTATLVEWMVEDGYGGQVLLGTDGARRSLWVSLGGTPGLAALRTDLGARLVERLDPVTIESVWVGNPARALTLA